ncbi:hypothetical protein P7C70_g6085, partial [Phenoliferia sp. Uapishka_3]
MPSSRQRDTHSQQLVQYHPYYRHGNNLPSHTLSSHTHFVHPQDITNYVEEPCQLLQRPDSYFAEPDVASSGYGYAYADYQRYTGFSSSTSSYWTRGNHAEEGDFSYYVSQDEVAQESTARMPTSHSYFSQQEQWTPTYDFAPDHHSYQSQQQYVPPPVNPSSPSHSYCSLHHLASPPDACADASDTKSARPSPTSDSSEDDHARVFSLSPPAYKSVPCIEQDQRPPSPHSVAPRARHRIRRDPYARATSQSGESSENAGEVDSFLSLGDLEKPETGSSVLDNLCRRAGVAPPFAEDVLALVWNGELSRVFEFSSRSDVLSMKPHPDNAIILFPPGTHRVVHDKNGYQSNPWESAKSANDWLRNQMDVCSCQRFRFVQGPKKDFKHPSVIRDHVSLCASRRSEDPLAILCRLERAAERYRDFPDFSVKLEACGAHIDTSTGGQKRSDINELRKH